MNRLLTCSLLCLTLLIPVTGYSAPDDGEVSTRSGEQQAWDARSGTWVSLGEFWQAYANRQGGYTWGHSDEYPEYNKVKEFDTFLVKTAHGDCLMQFFHSRWRRANDVQRWDDAFNRHAGCPYVFD